MRKQANRKVPQKRMCLRSLRKKARIDEEADTYAFLFQNIGVPYKPVAK